MKCHLSNTLLEKYDGFIVHTFVPNWVDNNHYDIIELYSDKWYRMNKKFKFICEAGYDKGRNVNTVKNSHGFLACLKEVDKFYNGE